ncbi:hypothetical protein E3P89_00807 [Wallemia ichthyophaga]|uniref:TIP41-like protein n=1 Tax=Wallemia ichthyophaga TaxID=245174 RepID=A0A4T0HIQ2_WALIC|nr:hypothetical protein E3P93_02233 [Wallemia ichthyophaga]TIB14863.1 hypothetical protein E3P90_01102 [Wallemia ichthyophaga]TIB24756.1 hypothetical protein E3P89_00807 [Wallemia ichthyophaga]TIB26565.1 hypothetical protein E3P88_00971 [Wallemia ichthyophaga]
MSDIHHGLVEGFSASDFTFNVTKGPSAAGSDFDCFTAELGFEPPRLLYPHNQIRIAHKLSNFTLGFYARPALNLVDKSGAEAKRVAYALHEGTKLQLQLPDKNYDWTYTTTYSGSSTRSFENTPYTSNTATPLLDDDNDVDHSTGGNSNHDYDNNHSHHDSDPTAIRNTITFFQDSMDGAGYTTLTATLRVDDDGFQVLQRHYVRIDRILFRMYETTFTHKFGTWKIEKRCKGWEGRWNEVVRRLPALYQVGQDESTQDYQDCVRDVLLSLSPDKKKALSKSHRNTNLQPAQMLRNTSNTSDSAGSRSGSKSASRSASASASAMSSRSGSRMGFAARVLLSRHNSSASNASGRRRRKHPPGALSFSSTRAHANSNAPAQARSSSKSKSATPSLSLQSSCVSPMSSGCCSPSAVSGAGTGWNGVGKWKFKIDLSDEHDDICRPLPSPFPPEDVDNYDDYEMDEWEYQRRMSFGYNNRYNDIFDDFSSGSSDDDGLGGYGELDVAQQLTKRLERFSRQYPERLEVGGSSSIASASASDCDDYFNDINDF